MRAGGPIRSGASVWVAGATPGGTVRVGSRHLFYLMRVGIRAASHAELWRLLPDEARLAKSATSHVLGDVFEPIDDELRGPAAWDHENYVPPKPGHSHDGGTRPYWHRDIEAEYNGLESITGDGTYKLPDFSFVTDGDDLVLWEHLGMMDVEVYDQDWQRKRTWYADQGYVEGDNLFMTSEVGGMQSAKIDETIDKVRAAIANY